MTSYMKIVLEVKGLLDANHPKDEILQHLSQAYHTDDADQLESYYQACIGIIKEADSRKRGPERPQ